MRCDEFRDSIRDYLRKHPEAATWTELRSSLHINGTISYRAPLI